METDAFRRAVFTLSPVRLTAGCPRADFSSLSDPPARKRSDGTIQRPLCVGRVPCLSGRGYEGKEYRGGSCFNPTQGGGQPTSRDLFGDLQTVKKLLEDDKQRDTCGWTQLEYHLAHKIRIVHSQTHPTQTAKTGRALRPEFALSVVEDLIELLTIWGFAG
jgi:hypothetical protein